MKSSSIDLYLNIKSNGSNEMPQEYSRAPKKITKKPVEQDAIKDTFIQIVSVILLCFFYTLLVKVKISPIEMKFYHSLSLGFLCLIDFLFNKDQYLQNINDGFDSEVNETLLDSEVYMRDMSSKEVYAFSIIYGAICFLTELLIFLILSYSVHYNNTLTNGFCLLALEAVVIRFHYSYSKRVDFTSFVGILIIIVLVLYSDIKYFEYVYIKILAVAISLALLKYFKFVLYYELNKRFKQQSLGELTLYANTLDFALGMLLLLVYLEQVNYNLRFNMYYCFIIFMGTLCYFFNVKFFLSNR
jgi:hypothetical protein